MVAYLSDDWFTAAEAALHASEALRQRTADLRFSLHQQVRGTPDGDVDYTVHFDHGATRLTIGPDAQATASFSTPYPVAVAIASGTMTAQAAFQNGDLRVGGNIGELMSQLHLLADLHDVFGPLRDETIFHA